MKKDKTMEIEITTLENMHITVDLAEVSSCHPNDDVIYFCGIPCLLSSASCSSNNEILQTIHQHQAQPERIEK